MNVLFDTNVVLDVLLEHEPWFTDAQALWQAHDTGRITGWMTATTLSDIFYIVRRVENRERAELAIDVCLRTFEICPVNRQSLEDAFHREGRDFEDKIQIACAVAQQLDVIVTRDPAGFAESPIPAEFPTTLLSKLRN